MCVAHVFRNHEDEDTRNTKKRVKAATAHSVYLNNCSPHPAKYFNCTTPPHVPDIDDEVFLKLLALFSEVVCFVVILLFVVVCFFVLLLFLRSSLAYFVL